MSSKIVAAVPYQRGHSDSRSKSKSDKRPSGLLAGADNAKTIAAEVQLVGSRPLLGNFGAPSTLLGGIYLPLSSVSANNLVAKPGEFQRRITQSPYTFKLKPGHSSNVSQVDSHRCSCS